MSFISLLFLFLSRTLALSGHGEATHQMYAEGLVIGTASFFHSDILFTLL